MPNDYYNNVIMVTSEKCPFEDNEQIKALNQEEEKGNTPPKCITVRRERRTARRKKSVLQDPAVCQ